MLNLSSMVLKRTKRLFFLSFFSYIYYIVYFVSLKTITMRHEEENEVTLVRVLNDGNVPFKRIIPGEDRAFVLEHRVLPNINKFQIVLFEIGPMEYRMFIYCKRTTKTIKAVNYKWPRNTWSIYNSLCKALNANFVDN